MSDEPHHNKAMPSPEGNQISKDRRKGTLKCIRDCVMPGIGEFHEGDTVENAELFEKLADHPYFAHDATEAK